MPEIQVPDFVDNRWQVLGVNGFNPPVTTFFCRDLRAKDPANDKAIIKSFPAESEYSGEIRDFLVDVNYLREVDIKGTLAIIQAKLHWMAFEYVTAPSLFKEITFNKPFAEKDAFGICRKIAIIMDQACDNEILHLALNPKNVFLLNDGTVKIKDWLVEEKNLTLFKGLTDPCFYQSPEVLAADPSGKLSDIYSLGIIAAFLVTGDWEVKFRLDEARLPDNLTKILPYFVAEDPAQRIQDWKEAVITFDGGRFVPVRKVEGAGEKVAEADLIEAEPKEKVDAPAKPLEKKKPPKEKTPRDPVMPRAKVALAGTLGSAASIIATAYKKVNWRIAGIVTAVALSVALVVTALYALPVLFSNGDTNQASGETVMLTLPSFAGMSIEEAESALCEMGCTVEKEDAFSEEFAAGLVISQDPEEGDYESDALAVKLVVSKGQEPQEETSAEGSDTSQQTTTTQPSTETPAATSEPAPAPQPAGQRPVAAFSMSPTSGPSSGVFVSFNASGSYDPDGGSIVSHAWSFGASGATTSHEFASPVAPTTIPITLTVTDDEGQSSSVTKSLSLY